MLITSHSCCCALIPEGTCYGIDPVQFHMPFHWCGVVDVASSVCYSHGCMEPMHNDKTRGHKIDKKCAVINLQKKTRGHKIAKKTANRKYRAFNITTRSNKTVKNFEAFKDTELASWDAGMPVPSHAAAWGIPSSAFLSHAAAT